MTPQQQAELERLFPRQLPKLSMRPSDSSKVYSATDIRMDGVINPYVGTVGSKVTAERLVAAYNAMPALLADLKAAKERHDSDVQALFHGLKLRQEVIEERDDLRAKLATANGERAELRTEAQPMPDGWAEQVKIDFPFFREIVDCRFRQDAKWGKAIDRNLPLPLWTTILTEEVGEVASAILKRARANLHEELIQVATVVVAMLEVMDATPWGVEEKDAG